MPAIAIVGAGLIGRSWAVVFARAGWRVRLVDTEEDRLAEARSSVFELLRERTSTSANEPGACRHEISLTTSLAEAVAGVQLVQECGPETLEVKRVLFEQLDELTPEDVILASSSSAIVASRFTQSLEHRERCLIAHPVNPPHLMPLVELCGAPWTDPNVVDRCRSLYAEVGQYPIVLHREIEGFVLNRLQGALLTEALRLVEEGTVSAPDLDSAVSNGLGLRWSFLGPFGTIELNAPGGMQDYFSRYGATFRSIAADPPSADVWENSHTSKVIASWDSDLDPVRLAEKARWRDRRLEALRVHKDSQEHYKED